MKPIILSLSLFAGVFLTAVAAAEGGAAPAAGKSDNVRSYLELMRSETNATKIKLLNELMKLTPEEAKKFWPVYREYEREQGDVGERKLRLIREFFTLYNAGNLNDEAAKKMAPQWLQNAQDRLDLWKKYHAKISTAVSPMRAAQFLQVENQLAIFVDFGIASEMPALGDKPVAK